LILSSRQALYAHKKICKSAPSLSSSSPAKKSMNSCTFCNKEVTTPGNLRRHLEICSLNPNKTTELQVLIHCSYCNKELPKQNYNSHKRRKHPELVQERKVHFTSSFPPGFDDDDDDDDNEGEWLVESPITVAQLLEEQQQKFLDYFQNPEAQKVLKTANWDNICAHIAEKYCEQPTDSEFIRKWKRSLSDFNNAYSFEDVSDEEDEEEEKEQDRKKKKKKRGLQQRMEDSEAQRLADRDHHRRVLCKMLSEPEEGISTITPDTQFGESYENIVKSKIDIQKLKETMKPTAAPSMDLQVFKNEMAEALKFSSKSWEATDDDFYG
jgi:hypothetical protein